MSNWSKLDYFLPMALDKEEHALVDIVGGKTAVNNGASKVFEGFFFVRANSEYIAMNYAPSIDGKKYSLNDAQIDVFVYSTLVTINGGIIGAVGSGGERAVLADQPQFTRFQGSVNAAIDTSKAAYELQDKTLVSAKRESSTEHILVFDGIEDSPTAQASSAMPDNSFDIGRRGINGQHFDGKISIASLGSGIGVNQIAKNDHYTQFLEELGLNLSPIINELAAEIITDTLEADIATDTIRADS